MPRPESAAARPSSPAAAAGGPRNRDDRPAGSAKTTAPPTPSAPPAVAAPVREPDAPRRNFEGQTRDTRALADAAPRAGAVGGVAAPAAPGPPGAPSTPEQKASDQPDAGAARSSVMVGERVAPGAAQAATVMVGTGKVSWMLASDGRITRLEDGRPAEQVASTGDVLRAGSAVSEMVAWAVGQNGAIWRTVDGQSWRRVPAPSSEDLVAISTQGPDAAVVTTAAGRRFTTRDAGRSWVSEAQ
jgi:hypothetical protein